MYKVHMILPDYVLEQIRKEHIIFNDVFVFRKVVCECDLVNLSVRICSPVSFLCMYENYHNVLCTSTRLHTHNL